MEDFSKERELLKRKLRQQSISTKATQIKNEEELPFEESLQAESPVQEEEQPTEADGISESSEELVDESADSDAKNEEPEVSESPFRSKADRKERGKSDAHPRRFSVKRDFSDDEVKNGEVPIRGSMSLWLGAGIAVFVVFFSYFLFNHYARFKKFDVVWTRDIPEGSFVGYQKFGSSLLKYSKDAATYLDKGGRTVWTDGFEMENPFIRTCGDFAAIADKQKNKICIYNLEGRVGEVETINPISRFTVSQYGVVATIEEDNASSYINYYYKDGSKIDLAIKSKMSGNGYPTDLAISPDGKQLMVAYAFVQNGSVRSRVVFYDFSGTYTDIPDRIVGGFDEPFVESLVGRVHYISGGNSFAVADTGLYIFSSRNPSSPQLFKEVKMQGRIEAIAYSEKYIALTLVSNKDGGSRRLEVYNISGGLVFKRNLSKAYSNLDIDGDYFFLFNENACSIFNAVGTEKFSGSTDFEISKITKEEGNNRFIISGPSMMKSIRLE